MGNSFFNNGWQLFRVFGGPVTEAENPWTLLARSSLSALLIGYAKPIFQITLNIATAPYTALMEVKMKKEDFTFVGVENALKNGLTTIVSIATVVGLLLLVILMIALGWNYFKLLLETVERYIVVGVLCYTSPLAFSMGASKTTVSVFKSWCRMVGSQLLLLVMNVWFLRGFSTSVGQYVGNGGELSNGNGSIFLWLFCAIAFLKTAQKFDSYLAAMGLNVAQTGSSMGLELMMAARAVSGLGSGARSAGSVFGGGSSAAATGAGAAAAGFAGKFKSNSYVRDAVVDGGVRMGAGGGLGFVGRVFGGMAARNGATLTSDSIASVASRNPKMSGTIGGEIADKSLANYMPQLKGVPLKDTQISGGKINTTAMSPDGRMAELNLYDKNQFEKPDGPSSLVEAADGSMWYQTAAGDGAGAFFGTPGFAGDISEAARISEMFPDLPEDTMLRTVDEGVLEASTESGNSCGTAVRFMRSRMPRMATYRLPMAWTGMRCNSMHRHRHLSPGRRQMPTISPSSRHSCRDMNSRYLLWMVPDGWKGRWKCSMRMVPGQDFMIHPSMQRLVAIIRYMRTAGAASGMPFMERHLWIESQSMRMGNRYTMATA